MKLLPVALTHEGEYAGFKFCDRGGGIGERGHGATMGTSTASRNLDRHTRIRAWHDPCNRQGAYRPMTAFAQSIRCLTGAAFHQAADQQRCGAMRPVVISVWNKHTGA